MKQFKFLAVLFAFSAAYCFATPSIAASIHDVQSVQAPEDTPHDYDETPSSIPALPISTTNYGARLALIKHDLELVPPRPRKALVDIQPIVRCSVLFHGQYLFVDNRPLRSTLWRLAVMPIDQRHQQTIADLTQQLSIVESGLNQPVAVNTVNKSVRLAKSVLRSNEFASIPIKPPSAFQTRMSALGDSITRAWEAFLHRLHISTGPIPHLHVDVRLTRIILFGILALALVLLVVLLVRSALVYFENRTTTVLRKSSSALAINEEEDQLVTKRDYSRLLALARQNSLIGEYRNAFRLVYLATLVLLDSAGVIKIDRSRTNWEFLRLIEKSEHQKLYGLKLPLTQDFDLVWYGHGAVNASDVEDAIKQFERIKEYVLESAFSTQGKKASR